MNILFIAGPGRSGTTALDQYLNDHPKILVCRERYKYTPKQKVSPKLFTSERIMNIEEEYGARGGKRKRRHHADLLSRKDFADLEWIGDKFPSYVRNLGLLADNNPGASFIFTYRPIEEVAESYEAVSRNPEDGWLGGKDGFLLGIENWNTALQNIRDFIESGVNPNALVVSYHDFFYNNKDCLPLLARFLDLEFDESVREAWRERSKSFEGGRREKEPLTKRQLSLVRDHADRDAEAWILGRIRKQWEEFELHKPEAARALIEERRRFAVRIAQERSKSKTQAQRIKSLCQRIEKLEGEAQKSRQAGTSDKSRVTGGRKLLDGFERIKSRMFGRK